MTFELFPINWELFIGLMLQQIAVIMIVSVYCFLVYQWCIRGKDGVEDSRETEVPGEPRGGASHDR